MCSVCPPKDVQLEKHLNEIICAVYVCEKQLLIHPEEMVKSGNLNINVKMMCWCDV